VITGIGKIGEHRLGLGVMDFTFLGGSMGSVVGEKLILRGTRTNERASDDEQFHRMERQYGSFYRAFNLPQVVEPDTISAKLAQGVLQVTLPKRPAAKSERIEIKDEN